MSNLLVTRATRLLSCLLVPLLLLYMPAEAQNRKITGRVTATDNQNPLAGVTVTVKGTSSGTTTDANGEFSLTAPLTAKTLVLSYIGFETQEVAVGTGRIMVGLRPSSHAMDEVVVVGYGTQKRGEVTSAISTVKASDFNQGGALNAMDLVQGKVAGLEIVRTSGDNPNSGVSIQLRSATSLTGTNSPLIIIDGIPNGNLDLLQQDDIASFDVLKDGSAAAIYGTQANGGVIIVTTKKGRSGPVHFDYSTYFKKDFILRKPDFLSPSQYRGLAASGKIDSQYVTGIYDANTNAFDSLVNHDNLTTYHQLAMSGGNDNVSYRASIFYSNLEGIAIANARKQYGGRFSMTAKGLDNRFHAQFDLAQNFNKANMEGGGQWLAAETRIPTLPIHDSINHFYTSKNSSNPVSDIAQTMYTRDQGTSSADAALSLDIWKGISVGISGSVMRNSYIDNQYADLNSDQSLYNNDQYPGGGYAYKGTDVTLDYNSNPTISYTRTFGGRHHVSAIGGYQYTYHTETSFSEDNRGFLSDDNQDNNIGAGQALADGRADMSSYKESEVLISYFARANYNFADKYFLQVSVRRDGSSKFGANDKWGNFPAISGGWDIAREDFMSHQKIFDDLKLRLGYGVTGNSGIPPYQSLVVLGTGGQYAFPDGVYRQTYGPANNPNPNLKWERKAETNLGIDFSLLHGRVTGTIDGFYRKTTDLLYNYTAQLPPYIQSSIYTNVGAMASKGIEVTLSGNVVKNRDFTWRMDVTASHASNKMLSFSNQLYHFSYLTTGGIPGPGALGNALRIDSNGAIGNFYGKKFAGLDANGHWLFYKADGKTKVGIQDYDPSLDDRVIGNAIPKFIFSWTNTFYYRNFDLRVFFRGRLGNKILNTMDLTYGNQENLPNNVLASALGKYGALHDTYEFSDYYLQPGGFLKLANVTLGYTFKLHNNYIRSLRLYASGNNLLLFTKYSGGDPDLVDDTGLAPGIEGQGAYPSTRDVAVGLNLGF